MKKRIIKTTFFITLIVIFLGQLGITLVELGQSIDNSALYAQLQQEKSQVEIKRTQLLSQYSQLQSLNAIAQSQEATQDYTQISNPLILTAPGVAIASNLSDNDNLD